MNENVNKTPKPLPTLEEQVRKTAPQEKAKQAHSVNVNGREVFVAYRTLRKRKRLDEMASTTLAQCVAESPR